MDPDQALENAREALSAFLTAEDACGGDDEALEAARDLADAFEALDGWLSKDGFPPAAWTHPVRGQVK